MLERMALFVLGGFGYMGVEFAWRGGSHWTMFVAGGVCLCLLQQLAARSLPLPLVAGIGAAGASGLELLIGVFSRRVLHIVVWDYSREWGNLAGLVCPRYSFYWFLLCGWVILVLRVAAQVAISPVYCTKKIPAEP